MRQVTLNPVGTSPRLRIRLSEKVSAHAAAFTGRNTVSVAHFPRLTRSRQTKLSASGLNPERNFSRYGVVSCGTANSRYRVVLPTGFNNEIPLK